MLGGRFQYFADSLSDLPVTGDWVLVRNGVIESLLPRRTVIRRKAAGTGRQEQVLAANVDVLFVVSALDDDMNLRRLERYLVIAMQGGVKPVFVLNKADLRADVDEAIDSVYRIAVGNEVLWMSAVDGRGVEQIRERIPAGVTGALIGSSGVGKSTLINRLLGADVQSVKQVRASDSRGRHTTAHRQIFRLPGGGLLMDQPGLREIQLWATEEGVEEAFPEIGALARQCKFTDCSHGGEPGCAVAAAILSGELDDARFSSFRKLTREAARFDMDRKKQEQKQMSRAIRKFYRDGNR